MLKEIINTILEIPAMVEFIIGAIIYFIISTLSGIIVSEIAQETVCNKIGLTNWFYCFYLTNPLMAFLFTIGTFIVLGFLFRAKFL